VTVSLAVVAVVCAIEPVETGLLANTVAVCDNVSGMVMLASPFVVVKELTTVLIN
jgi:hypothetical protein